MQSNIRKPIPLSKINTRNTLSLLYVNGTSKTGTIDLENMRLIVKNYKIKN